MKIDDLAIELSEVFNYSQSLEKGMPPKLQYRLRSWLKRHGSKKNAKDILTTKMEEAISLKSLKKNEVMASLYDSGELKFDFGAEVPEDVKKAAIGWAKRRGLRAKEASLAKSNANYSSMTFGSNTIDNKDQLCLARHKWEIN